MPSRPTRTDPNGQVDRTRRPGLGWPVAAGQIARTRAEYRAGLGIESPGEARGIGTTYCAVQTGQPTQLDDLFV